MAVHTILPVQADLLSVGAEAVTEVLAVGAATAAMAIAVSPACRQIQQER